MTRQHNSHSLEEVAIIGMSGRFPGARNLAEFWDNLRNGVESIRFFSEAALRIYCGDSAARSRPRGGADRGCGQAK